MPDFEIFFKRINVIETTREPDKSNPYIKICGFDELNPYIDMV